MRLALALLLLGGCNSILGVGEFTAGDAAVDPNTVTGTSQISYVLYDGMIEDGPEDLSKYTIKAYIPDATGRFTTVNGIGRADGTFEIPNITPGTLYYLYLLYPQIPNHAAPFPRVWVTSARTLDLGYHVSGRRDAVEATRASSIVLNVTNMVPWTDSDYLVIDSYNNGSEFSDVSVASNAPARGATSLAGFSFDWRDGYTYHPVGSLPRLVDASAGDDFIVTHIHNEDINEATWAWSLTRQAGVVKRTDLIQTDGAPLVINEAFVQTPYTKSQMLQFDLGAFRAQYAADGGRVAFEMFSVSRLDNAGTQYQQRIGSGPWGLFVPVPGTTLARVPDVVSLPSIMYGDSAAFPSTWGQSVVGSYLRRRRLRAPGAAPVSISMVSDFTRPATSLVDARPQIRPVTKLMVGGTDLLGNAGAIAFDGTTGVSISWDAVPQADGYTVDVVRIYADAGLTARAQVLRAATTATSFVIPPDMLVKGQRYTIGVTTHAGLDETGLRRTRIPSGNARMHGNAFLFSNSCGDGVTQAELGEECDEMGETASCDADCTLVMCGDATTNVAAAEMCDGGGTSIGCDSDCTSVSCGDGFYNPQAEYCDDGNAIDADGCDALCQRTGTCGDGTVQPSVEDCDPPDGTTCGTTCTSL
ncbi:MAG: hypothetical protein H0T46_04275 [Deltaproteobacteria bacterium]|nr:hypothetical protein [Deltaproteobacteria bacterium]